MAFARSRIGELNSPEMRRRRQKFKSYSLPLVGSVAKIHDAALLFFVAGRICHLQLRAHFHRFVQIEKAAVRVDYDGLASLAEFVAVAVQAANLYRNACEDA